MDQQIARPRGRQILLQWLPIIAVVEADEHAGFVARVKQSRPYGIGTDGTDDLVCGKPAGDLRPTAAAVMRAEDVGTEIVEPLGVDGDIGARRVERRKVDARNLAPLGDSGELDLRPT